MSGQEAQITYITYKMLKGCEGKHHTPTGYVDLRPLKSNRPQPPRAPLMGHNKSAIAWEWQKRVISNALQTSHTPVGKLKLRKPSALKQLCCGWK